MAPPPSAPAARADAMPPRSRRRAAAAGGAAAPRLFSPPALLGALLGAAPAGGVTNAGQTSGGTPTFQFVTIDGCPAPRKWRSPQLQYQLGEELDRLFARHAGHRAAGPVTGGTYFTIPLLMMHDKVPPLSSACQKCRKSIDAVLANAQQPWYATVNVPFPRHVGDYYSPSCRNLLVEAMARITFLTIEGLAPVSYLSAPPQCVWDRGQRGGHGYRGYMPPATQGWVSIPYPHTDKVFRGGKYMVSNAVELRSRRKHMMTKRRKWLWTYSGQPRSRLRQAIARACAASADCRRGEEKDSGAKRGKTMQVFAQMYELSKFCAMPYGTTPSRHGLFHALWAGCVPVMFDDGTCNYMEQAYHPFLPATRRKSYGWGDWSVLLSARETTRRGPAYISEQLHALLQMDGGKRYRDTLNGVLRVMPRIVYRPPNSLGQGVKTAFDIVVSMVSVRCPAYLDDDPVHQAKWARPGVAGPATDEKASWAPATACAAAEAAPEQDLRCQLDASLSGCPKHGEAAPPDDWLPGHKPRFTAPPAPPPAFTPLAEWAKQNLKNYSKLSPRRRRSDGAGAFFDREKRGHGDGRKRKKVSSTAQLETNPLPAPPATSNLFGSSTIDAPLRPSTESPSLPPPPPGHKRRKGASLRRQLHQKYLCYPGGHFSRTKDVFVIKHMRHISMCQRQCSKDKDCQAVLHDGAWCTGKAIINSTQAIDYQTGLYGENKANDSKPATTPAPYVMEKPKYVPPEPGEESEDTILCLKEVEQHLFDLPRADGLGFLAAAAGKAAAEVGVKKQPPASSGATGDDGGGGAIEEGD